MSELLITACENSQQFSATLWDFETGNALKQYKNGGIVQKNTLHRVRNDFFLSTEKGKPIVHLWPLNSQEPRKQPRIILPGVADCLSISPDGYYVCVGIESKLYTWHLNSGKLLSVQQKHLRKINCVRFSQNGDFLLTGGEDGMVVCYNFGDLSCVQSNYLTQTEIGRIEPIYTKLDHSMPVTDLKIGSFGMNSRFATVSLDCTLRIYDLSKGEPLLVLIFGEPLTALIMDVCFWNFYIGTSTGLIYHFNVQNPPRTLDFHVEKGDNQLKGHENKINCLSLNLSGRILASGSEDNFVFIWDLSSRQILRKIEHKAPITNLFFMLNHSNISAGNFKATVIIKGLQRSFEESNIVASIMQNEDIHESDEEDVEQITGHVEVIKDTDSELIKAKIINKQLYDALLKTIK